MAVFVRRARRIALLFAGIFLSVSTVQARPPEIRNVNFRGLQIGAATTLTVDGLDLLPEPRVYLNDQLLNATLDPQSSAGRVVLAIQVPEAVLPGFGQLRLATAEGFSNALLVGLDRLPQLPLADDIQAIPAALHGSVPGSGISKTAFAAKAGQEFIVEAEARRLGSKLRPVLHVYDERRVQIAWARPSNTLTGDTRVLFKAPKDGRYSVELHDAQYAPPGVSFFRLKVGLWQFADLAFPPVIPQGRESTVELLGNLGSPRVPLKPASGAELIAVPLPNPSGSSGAAPTIAVSPWPEVIESTASDQPLNLSSVPISVSGRLNAPGQRDRFLMPVTAGMKLTFDVFAERIGSRIDTSLELKNKMGGVLVANDDAPGTTDSRLDFVVPAGIDVLEISLRDTLDLGQPDSLYRLVVTPTEMPRIDFGATVKTDAVNVASGETQVLEVFIDRRGYTGPLQILTTGLPPGIALTGTEIPAGANGTLLNFTNTGAASAQFVGQLRAQSPDGSLIRTANVQTQSDERTPVWLRDRLAVATTPKVVDPFQVAWANADAVPQLPLASKQSLALTITRPPSTYGPVRLSLVSSHPIPKTNGQPNPALSVRIETPVEVPVDPAVKVAGDAFVAADKQHAEAVKAALAAQGDAKVAAEAKVQELLKLKTAAETALRAVEAKAKYPSQLSLVIPASMSEPVCDLSVRAELLNPERNLVLRTTYASVRRLPILNPLVVKLVGAPLLETTLDPKTGATIKLAGNIERLSGYSGVVAITVTGLPAGVTATNATVNADQTQFAIELKLPPNFEPTEIKGLKLTATGPADPLSGNIPVKSVDVDLSVKVNK